MFILLMEGFGNKLSPLHFLMSVIVVLPSRSLTLKFLQSSIVLTRTRHGRRCKVAATTACLFFGFLDGATTISESYGGGGGNNELPKKKDNEDDLSFARRCHQMAKIMHAPRYKYGRGR